VLNWTSKCVWISFHDFYGKKNDCQFSSCTIADFARAVRLIWILLSALSPTLLKLPLEKVRVSNAKLQLIKLILLTKVVDNKVLWIGSHFDIESRKLQKWCMYNFFGLCISKRDADFFNIRKMFVMTKSHNRLSIFSQSFVKTL